VQYAQACVCRAYDNCVAQAQQQRCVCACVRVCMCVCVRVLTCAHVCLPVRVHVFCVNDGGVAQARQQRWVWIHACEIVHMRV